MKLIDNSCLETELDAIAKELLEKGKIGNPQLTTMDETIAYLISLYKDTKGIRLQENLQETTITQEFRCSEKFKEYLTNICAPYCDSMTDQEFNYLIEGMHDKLKEYLKKHIDSM